MLFRSWARMLERDVRGVVGTEEELRAGAREALDAPRERRADLHVVARVPCRHGVAHPDAIERDVGVEVSTGMTELEKAESRTVGAVRDETRMSHAAILGLRLELLQHLPRVRVRRVELERLAVVLDR